MTAQKTDTRIVGVRARQILDSRGQPTVEADVHLACGSMGRANVPAGASRGKAEAYELRDGGEDWEGRGVGRAVLNVNGEIAARLQGCDAIDQLELDTRLRALDGTANWSRLGANAALGVSLSALRAAAHAQGLPLHQRIAALSSSTACLPMPMVNILSGGLHARRGMDIQDFLIVPLGAQSYSQALDWSCRVRASASRLCERRGITTLLADEGGLSPGFSTTEEALNLIVEAIDDARLSAPEDVAIALDVAASSLLDASGRYAFGRQGRHYESTELIELLANLSSRYPIISIEDGLAEEDWDNWRELTRRLGHLQLIGDDLLATQPDRIRRASRQGAANSVLIKLNQNGTVSGTLEACAAARAHGYTLVVSARSGETEDDLLADLAVGLGAGQIKIGSVRNSERLAKYNQLLRLEEQGLPWAGRAVFKGT